MKKINKIILLFALTLMIVCLFAACTENTKQDAIETSNAYTEITSNGGVAVQYGNYLYFVNGYVGSDALNTFGSVKTGAICRVELKKNTDGKLYFAPDTFTVVVPKNVYGTDTTNPGIYIVNDYIYYHTTSVEKNSKREYKTSEGVIMRTKIDGTGSETVASFKDNATVFRVSDNYLVYTTKDEDGNSNLHAISLSDLSDKVIESQNVLAYKFSDNYVVFTTINSERANNNSSDYLVKIFDFKSGKTQLLLNSYLYNQKSENGPLYKTTVTSVQETKDVVYLFYSKEDNTGNKVYDGYYFCFFPKANLKYDIKNEYRMTFQTSTTTYDNFYRLENDWILAYHDKVFDIYDSFKSEPNTFGTASRMKNEETAQKNGAYLNYTVTGATGLVGVYENDEEVYAYFTTSSKIDETSYTALNYIKLFSKVNGEYAVAKENVAVFFYFNNNSSYTTYEVADLKYYTSTGTATEKAIYFLNSDLGDKAYACYYIFQDGNDKTDAEKKAAGKLLGNIDEEELVDLISSGKVEENN